MFDWIFSPEAWLSLVTLTGLEIVLGIDNIIFIAILVGKLPPEQRDKGRILGLSLAMLTRIALLLSLFWIMKLTKPLFSVFDFTITGRDLVLILGGLFLIGKSTQASAASTKSTRRARDMRISGSLSPRLRCLTSSFRSIASSPQWVWQTISRS